MKKNILLGLIISTMVAHYAFAGSFAQRFGANSYLTNLPLYYEDGNPKKTANRYNDNNTETRSVQQCNNGSCSVNNRQRVQVVTVKQTAAERKRAKLQKKINKLEQKKYELVATKNNDIQPTVIG